MAAYKLIVMLHILGATVWVGGHLVLSLTVLPRALRAGSPTLLREFEAGYERIGIPALVVQVLTGLWLAYHWLPQPRLWIVPEGPLPFLISMKIGLLIATIVLAAHARLRVIPKLAAENLRFLALHIVLVTLIGVAFVILGVGIRTGGL